METELPYPRHRDGDDHEQKDGQDRGNDGWRLVRHCFTTHEAQP